MYLSVCFKEFYWDLLVVPFIVISLVRGWFSCNFAVMFLEDCCSFKPVWGVVFASSVYSFSPISEGPCYSDGHQVCLFLMMSCSPEGSEESLTCVKVQYL